MFIIASVVGCDGGKNTSSSTSSSASSSSSSSSSSSASSSSSGGVIAHCNATEFEQPADIRMQRLATSEGFQQPTGLTFLPGNDDIMFVLQQNGVIWRIDDRQGEMATEIFVDLRDYFNVIYIPEGPGGCHECGLYSMAFHPDFADNGYIYLSFTEGGGPGSAMHSYVTRFRTDDGGATLAREENGFPWREDIYHVAQPTRIHNNGQIKFGPDGYLYVGFGDGGPGGNPNQNAQNPSNPFGSILRLMDDGTPAPGNLVEGGLPEIFAYGLRNPWHWSFDRETGQLWVGDVGQARFEEINLIVNGGNYGWPCYEGHRTFDGCIGEGPFVAPLLDYSHEEGKSVTGGYVYRGHALPELYGTYIFGDFVTGMVWGMFEEDGLYHRVNLLASGKYISGFSEDSKGELYVLDYAGGDIYRIVPAEENTSLIPLPARLSATGCVDVNDPTQPASKLVAYDINEPFWSDNAEKERFFTFPDNKKIHVEQDGDFIFPIGSVLVKHFHLEGKLIETRLLLNQENTGWSGFSYQWNEAQTEAFLLESGKDVEIADQQWRFPGRAECSQCHTPAAGFALGLEALQLNKTFTYGSGQTANQLTYLEENELLASTLSTDQRNMTLASSGDDSLPLEARALSYLHSNCSQCHRPGGTSQATLDFRIQAGLPFMNACNQEPMQGDLGVIGAKLLSPGDHTQSIIWHRMAHDEDYRMPPLGSHLLDTAGADLLKDWIDSLAECSTIVGPEGAQYVIRNKQDDHFLSADDAALTTAESSPALVWSVETWDGFYRIHDAQDANRYIHIEHASPEVSAIDDAWWSAQWYLEPTGDYFRIRNRWKGDLYLYVSPASGVVEVGSSASMSDGALWSFEQAD